MRLVLGGNKKRTCDAKCYNAKGKKCVCVCGGANHGIGLNKVIDNLNLVAQKILEFPGLKLLRDGIQDPPELLDAGEVIKTIVQIKAIRGRVKR